MIASEMMITIVFFSPFGGRLLSLTRKELDFSSKFPVVFDAIQLSEHTVDLIDHHVFNMFFLNDAASVYLRPKLTEFLGYL